MIEYEEEISQPLKICCGVKPDSRIVFGCFYSYHWIKCTICGRGVSGEGDLLKDIELWNEV